MFTLCLGSETKQSILMDTKKHKGNDWMTDDLLDIINLKNRL